MGGRGSGSWYRLSTKDTVDGYRRVDVRQMQREGCLQPGTRVSWCWWSDAERKDKTASINVRVAQESVTLEYRHRRQGEEWQDVKEPVPLTWTTCNYGGRRPWFLCPGVVNAAEGWRSCTALAVTSCADTVTAWRMRASERAARTD